MENAVAQLKGKERADSLGSGGSGSPVSSTPPDVAGLSISPRRQSPPPRPSPLTKRGAPPPPAKKPSPPPPPVQREDDSEEDDDDNDPFADRNAVQTPRVETGQPRW